MHAGSVRFNSRGQRPRRAKQYLFDPERVGFNFTDLCDPCRVGMVRDSSPWALPTTIQFVRNANVNATDPVEDLLLTLICRPGVEISGVNPLPRLLVRSSETKFRRRLRHESHLVATRRLRFQTKVLNTYFHGTMMAITGAQMKTWAISSAGEPASVPARHNGKATTITQSVL